MEEKSPPGPPGDTAPPLPSLIQQRVALDRERAIGLWLTSASGIFLLLGLILLLTGPERVFWGSLLTPALLLAVGLFRLWAYRQSRSAFEAAHGRDAGTQPVVGR